MKKAKKKKNNLRNCRMANRELDRRNYKSIILMKHLPMILWIANIFRRKKKLKIGKEYKFSFYSGIYMGQQNEGLLFKMTSVYPFEVAKNGIVGIGVNEQEFIKLYLTK